AQRPGVWVTLSISGPWLGPGLVCRGGWVSGPAWRLWPLAWGSWVSPGEGAVPEAVAGGALAVADDPDGERTAVEQPVVDPVAGGVAAESAFGCVREVGYLVADDQPPAGLEAHLAGGQIVGGGGAAVAGNAVGADPHLPGPSRQRDSVCRVAKALGARDLRLCDVPGPAAQHLTRDAACLHRHDGCCGRGQVAARGEPYVRT